MHVTRDGCELLTRRNRLLKNSEDVAWADLGPLSTPAAWVQRQEKAEGGT